MPALRTIRVTHYVTPLREGGSLPAIEGDDDGMYVLKFRGVILSCADADFLDARIEIDEPPILPPLWSG